MTDPSGDPAVPGPIEALCLPHYVQAASGAAVFELGLRLVADRFEQTRKTAFKDLSVLLDCVTGAFAGRLTNTEIKTLKSCVTVRNKIFHQELSRATGKLRALGEHLHEAGVWKVDLTTGDATAVRTTSTQTGRIVGWLLESSGSGAFAAAADLFQEGSRVLWHLLDRMNATTAAEGGDVKSGLPRLEQALRAMSGEPVDDDGEI